jgi:BASS family bile acid:Na+ symporter
MMLSVGLSVSLSDLSCVGQKRSIVWRAMLANYFFFPVLAIALPTLFHARPLVAAGFLILAVCPGAPYAPTCTAVAKGNVPLAVGLMVILAGTSVVISPLLLRQLLQKLGAGDGLHVDAGRMIGTLLMTQLLPLFAGLAVRRWHPAVADRLRSPSTLANKALNLAVMVLVLVSQFHALAEIRLRGLAGMFIMLAASLLIGWLSGGPRPEDRKAMAEVTSIRNAGVGMVIASRSFAGTPALSALVVYALFSILGSLLVALFWGRRALVESKAH